MCVPVTPRPHNTCVPPTCALLEVCAQHNCCAPAVKMLGGTTLEAPSHGRIPQGQNRGQIGSKLGCHSCSTAGCSNEHTLAGLQRKQQGACREAAPAAACTLQQEHISALWSTGHASILRQPAPHMCMSPYPAAAAAAAAPWQKPCLPTPTRPATAEHRHLLACLQLTASRPVTAAHTHPASSPVTWWRPGTP